MSDTTLPPRIHQLDPATITRIAAGEVIERPSSVVKELLENAVDAGSTRVDIDLEQGGTELIRVVDDGCGIERDDLPLAFVSHATSKLRDADDLFAIATMGFRGEALASIGGVARVTLQSRARGQSVGAEIRCDGGELSPIRPWNGATGTRVEVRQLFYTVPVRKKFLKGIATELGHVTEAVIRLALSHPGLHITLRHNGKLVYEVPSTASLVDRIVLFFGGEFRGKLYEVDSGPGPVRVTGQVADPALDRGNAKLQYLFVNSRWFRDRSLAHALQEAYRGLIMTGRYPVGFLFLTVPPEQVDVNVHPTKAEVRFRENSILYSLIRGSVKTRLLQEQLVPHLVAPPESFTLRPPSAPRPSTLFPPRPEPVPMVPPPATLPRPGLAPWELPEAVEEESEPTPLPLPPVPVSTPVTATVTEPLPPPPPAPAPAATEPDFASLSLPTLTPGQALQVHDSYLVLETPQGMLVIDQHALHERILYEQLRTRIRDGKLEVQRLLIPEPIELPPDQAAGVLDVKDELASLGLEVSDFGGSTILLSSYPTLLSRRSPREILQGVIDWLVTKDRPPSKEVLLDHLLATMACKAAVKAGDRLTPEEISHLLHLRQMAEDSHHCPHGRPTSLLFSRQELDRQFRRI